MGMTFETCRFIVEACRSGLAPGRVLTLGRQSLTASPEQLADLLRELSPGSDAAAHARWTTELGLVPRRFEQFMKLLGASLVEAADASSYEGAEVLHDFNEPVPNEWEQRYDLVLDGGTLEHVFNFPTAIRNCMRLLRVGGHLLLFTPANNYCGHGLYQFSPELFFRLLSPDNGFEVERLHAMVDTAGFSRLLSVKYAFPIRGKRFEVADPLKVHERVVLVNSEPVLLFVQARRTRLVDPLRTPPHQTDYLDQWARGVPQHPLEQTKSGQAISDRLVRLFGERFCRETLPRLAILVDPFRRRRFLRKLSFDNRAHYVPVPSSQHGSVVPRQRQPL